MKIKSQPLLKHFHNADEATARKQTAHVIKAIRWLGQGWVHHPKHVAKPSRFAERASVEILRGGAGREIHEASFAPMLPMFQYWIGAFILVILLCGVWLGGGR